MRSRCRRVFILLCLPIWLASCGGDDIVSRLSDIELTGSRSSDLPLTLTSDRPELNADGMDTTIIRASVRDAGNVPVVGVTVTFRVNPLGFVGAAGLLSRASGETDDMGEVVTTLTAPDISFVPPESRIQVTAIAEGTGFDTAPTQQIDIILLPKGAPPTGEGGEPVISEMLPSSGPTEAPTEVVLQGMGFDPGSIVTFQGDALPPVQVTPTVVQPTRIRLLTPAVAAEQAGPAEVFVTNPGGIISNKVIFIFGGAPGPMLTSLSPSAGPTQGGTVVTIQGSGFSQGDVVVFKGDTVPGGEVTICGSSGPPTCDNRTGIPLVMGCVPGNTGDYVRINSGTLNVLTQCVGPEGGGVTEVFIRTAAGQLSNSLSFGYAGQPGVVVPEIVSVQQTMVTQACANTCSGNDPCCQFLGYQIIVLGMNFDPCASFVIVHNGVVHELLPSPAGLHQANAGSGPTIACTLDVGLPGDCSPARPDLVPWPHDQIVNANTTSCAPFAPASLNKGAYIWQDANEIRLIYGPLEVLACSLQDDAQIYISNKPGAGLVSDGISPPVQFSFICMQPPAPPPPP